jgi:ABC-2 type transport system permease protein
MAWHAARVGGVSVISRIVRHEWRLLAREGSLWLTVAIFALAIGYGMFNGTRWARFQHEAVAEAVREEQERFATQHLAITRINSGELKLSPFADPRNPQTAGSRLGARYAVMPPSPLAALAVGQSDVLPSYFKITSDARENVTAGVELENPQRLLTGRFDVAFVLIYLYPLLIVAMSYNVLSGEKEQGTLGLALSQPISLRTLLVGKLALRFGFFVIAVALLVTLAALSAGVSLAEDGALMRLLLWAAAVAAYGLVWFALATTVAAYGRPSSTNAMALAAIWLGFVVLVPSLLNMVSMTAYPVPSRVEMIQAMREASDDANRQGSKLLSRYYEDHPELASGSAEQAMNDFNVLRVAVGAEVEQRVRPVMDRYEAQLAGQQRLVTRLRLLSPAILMQDALNDISGSGLPRHRHFMEQVRAFHERWRSHFVPLIFRKAQIERYDTLPRFAYREEPLSAVAQRVVISVMLLLVLAAVIGAAGFVRLRRYPIA